MKPGFKQTEVGMIPEDWDVVRLSSLISAGPKNGYSGRSSKDVGGTPTLALTATTSGRMILDVNTVKYLEEMLAENSDVLLRTGDVLVQRSNTLELVGTTAIFDGPFGVYAYPDLMMRIRFKAPETANWFWRYANSSGGRGYFISVAAGSTGTMPKLSGDKLRTMPLPLPPPPEQEAITSVLGDADALIESLERLVAKKRDIKQGAMQELLTARRRLPGFTGKWETKKLGEVLTIAHGKNQHAVADDSGVYPILGTGGLMGMANRFLYDKPSVLIGRKGTIDWPQFMDTPFWTVDTLFYSIIHESNNAKFLYYRFCLINWKQYNEASGVPSLNAKTIERIEIEIPKEGEQSAIAAVLSGMDSEIAALEAKLEKARAIKQGMMQELLTGRIRLK